jgi:acyl-CoA thioester hydrolase
VIREEVIAAAPLVIRRRVLWGECDPAGVVYTPRFADYVTSAFHVFLEQLLGEPLQEKLHELDVGTPAKAMSFEFKRSLWPDQLFDMSVRVSAIRTRTFDLDIRAAHVAGEEVFRASFTAICVDYTVRQGKPVPALLREKLTAYRDACNGQSSDGR